MKKTILLGLGAIAVAGIASAGALTASQIPLVSTNAYNAVWHIKGKYAGNNWDHLDAFALNDGGTRYEKTISFSKDDTFKIYENADGSGYELHRAMNESLLNYDNGWFAYTNCGEYNNFQMKYSGLYTIFYNPAITSWEHPGYGFGIEDRVQVWINDYLHFADYDSEKTGATTGYCNDDTHHYYADAKSALIALGADGIAAFTNNSDKLYTDALARYTAWAAAAKDATPYSIPEGLASVNAMADESNSVSLLVPMIGATSLALGGLFLLRKKRAE